MDFSNDILQPMPVALLSEYQAACVAHFPYALRGHHFLLLQQRWMENGMDEYANISNRLKFVIYVHRNGKSENCTYIAINDSATHHDVSRIISNSLI